MATAQAAPRHFLLTGVPGVGKTTLMRKIHENLVKQGLSCSGFITEEVQASGRRVGFDVVTLDGHRGHLARVSHPSDNMGTKQRECKVGQYSVKLLSFEQTALPTLRPQAKGPSDTLQTRQIYLVDEIGKMELFSQSFVQAVHKLISLTDITMIATIPVPKGKPIPLVEELRAGPHSLVFEVTRQNRDNILNDVMAAIQSSLQVNQSR